MNYKKLTLLALVGAALPTAASADPCGMVPPMWAPPNPITRVGAQKTYVFHSKGVETMVLRPAFSGAVDQFGMLIPFPSPPEIRKVSDDIFAHVAKAVDPPEFRLQLGFRGRGRRSLAPMAATRSEGAKDAAGVGDSLSFNEVRVLKQEAVGMYEVAVLEAGSSQALKRWMEDHEFRFPDGMEKTTTEYVDARWCFVAVKARVGKKASVDPRPGMRAANPQLPKGAQFNGAVQAMGFRFKVKELVVPMRLSAFNKGELHNVVYLLSDRPMKISQLPEGMVKRQVKGSELVRNVTQLLPVRVFGGSVGAVNQQHMRMLPNRDPSKVNGFAKELFLSDIRASAQGQLISRSEIREKSLLDIEEALNLRGAQVDGIRHELISDEVSSENARFLKRLSKMTLTVVDGNFPRELLAAENLRFSSFWMDKAKNSAVTYSATRFGPTGRLGGQVFFGVPRHLR